MKKFFQLVMVSLLAVICLTATSCTKKEKLYILNWDEYIDEDLLDAFEKEYNCDVELQKVDSCEIMYSEIKRGNQYDICIPSDYMISQMKEEGMIKELDYDKLSNYEYNDFDASLRTLIEKDAASYKNYFVPYFWGSLGIMYNTSTLSEEQIAKIKTDGFNILFDKTFSSNIGMYNTSRDSIAAALLALGYSLNTTDAAQLNAAKDKLMTMKGQYKAWATDDLKYGVASGKYDLALVYSGDFFDVLYAALEEEEEVNFECYAPEDANNVFFDAMVIPSTCQNEELAYKFIDFMLNEENSLQNAQYVGYCPTLSSVYEAMVSDPELVGVTDLDVYYPGDIVNGEVYKYLGAEIYDKYEEIFKLVK